jgi:hypothetical protein
MEGLIIPEIDPFGMASTYSDEKVHEMQSFS